MDRARTPLLEQALVLGRGIALVAAEVVTRVELAELVHEGIAFDLGNDGGGGDGDAEGVAIDDGSDIREREIKGVADDCIGPDGELFEGAEHAESSRGEDADAIDFLDGGPTDGERHGVTDLRGEFIAGFFGKDLGVADLGLPAESAASRQHHHPGRDRPGDRPAADLIDPGHPVRSGVPCLAFET